MATTKSTEEDRRPDEAYESYSRTIWQMAWPAVALNSLQVVNNILDRYFIGHLDIAALTGQSASMTITFLLFSLAMALAAGPGAIVSRAFGAGDRVEFQQAAGQSCSLAFLGGSIVAVIGAIITPFLAHIVLPPNAHAAQQMMLHYVWIFCTALPAIYVIQTLAASMRGIGDPKSPMWISGLQILIHIMLNYLLIFPARSIVVGGAKFVVPGFNMGLPGAATALSLSAWIAACIYLVYSRHTPLGSCFRLAMPSRVWSARLLKIAIPSAGQNVLRVCSLMAFTSILAHVPHGEFAIAALGPGFSVESIMFMPAFGLAFAASALVGQSLGMQKPDRAYKIGMLASHYGAIVILALVVPVYFGADRIATTMIESKPSVAALERGPEAAQAETTAKLRTIQEAETLIRWLCLTEVMFAYAMILIGALQGAGDTVRPFWIAVVSLWVLRVPLAYLFAIVLGMGTVGAWIAMSLTQAIQGFASIYAWRLGHWRAIKV